ncbi:MAG: RNA polymerase factor sigma-54 [Planctomycetota bacterium]|nr:RNA polymerase factor sigma-54 [Planctomycetota bacterium]
MRMEVSLQLRLEQKLRLAPQIIQSIEILQLPALELQDLVKEELEQNPTLEEDLVTPDAEEEPSSEDDLERELEGLERVDAVWNDYFSSAGRSANGAGTEDRKREAMENTAAPSVTLQEYLIQQLHLLSIISAADRDFISWMRERGGDDREIVSEIRALAEYLIYNLDDNGYLPYSLEDLIESFAADTSPPVPPTEIGQSGDPVEMDTPASGNVEHPASGDMKPPASGDMKPMVTAEGENGAEGKVDALTPAADAQPPPAVEPSALSETAAAPAEPVSHGGSEDDPSTLLLEPPEFSANGTNGARLYIAQQTLRIIQRFDPPGVGGRNLKEVLLLQLGSDPEKFKEERRIIENHLPDIQNNRLPKIAKALGTDLEEIKERIAFIRMLNPRPGSLFAEKAAHYIIPDVVVTEVDGNYEIRLEDTYIPRIHISPHYRRMLAEQADNPKVREFIKKKLEAAKWLIESIEQRQNTLMRINREIIKVQRDFLDYGLERLKPLKMQHIADRVGVHVSTVSRALSEKYIQTPRGIYPMKFFFTGGMMGHDGTMESTLSIKQKVRQIIEKEDKKSPLSDEDIARILRREKGLAIARRTVTKYRKQLSIPSSRQRRTY